MADQALDDLLAQRAELDRQIANSDLVQIDAALLALGVPAVTSLATALSVTAAGLSPGTAKTQITNILIVLSTVPGVLADERAALALLAAPAA